MQTLNSNRVMTIAQRKALLGARSTQPSSLAAKRKPKPRAGRPKPPKAALNMAVLASEVTIPPSRHGALLMRCADAAGAANVGLRGRARHAANAQDAADQAPHVGRHVEAGAAGARHGHQRAGDQGPGRSRHGLRGAVVRQSEVRAVARIVPAGGSGIAAARCIMYVHSETGEAMLLCARK